MKHRQMGGRGRHLINPDNLSEHHHRGRHRHHHGGRHGGRLFDYGELRLLLLAMIAERPRHGYELIKAIEERFGGSYTPSPGVMYPTLSWLDDMGYAAIEAEEGGRKRYRITSEGEAFLVANRAAADALLSRAGPAGATGDGRVPAPVVRAMENLKLAMRLRLRQGPLDQAAAESIATALDAAAQTVERS
jgi:DNA-binding PadR family transcriptional regulator